MCRNIRRLYNFDPPATEEEIRSAALQYVRKISGFQKPSRINEIAFNAAVAEITRVSNDLVAALKTSAPAKDRAVEAERALMRAAKRFS
ncbi:MAG TPA: DUF2277 domain-containing protein [Levilinea sp.]|nr:DUF2277 domain-containing protein [Levilinea sp.]